MSLLKKWGIGAELFFEAGTAVRNMTRASRAAQAVRGTFERLRSGVDRLQSGLTRLGAAATPIGLIFGAGAAQASHLAAELEQQQLVMEVLLGSFEKSEKLLGAINREARKTPFQEGDLIEGSKRLLRLTGDNVEANLELLKLTELIAALNPDRTVVDAAEAILDAAGGSGFERLTELGLRLSADQFKQHGAAGGQRYATAVIDAIEKEFNRRTGGVDLVERLSSTTGGRLSTLRDSVTNALKEIGQRINEVLSPAVVDVTKRIERLVPVFVTGFDRMATRLISWWDKVKPYLDQLLDWWDGLAETTQQRVAEIILLVGTVISGMLALGGTLAVVGLALTGLFAILGGVATILGGVFSSATLYAAAAVALLSAELAFFFAMFRAEGEGPIQFAQRMGQAIYSWLKFGFEQASAAALAFGTGFLRTVAAPARSALERLREPIQRVTGLLLDLISYVFGREVDLTSWTEIGRVVGVVVGHAIQFAADMLLYLVSGFEIALHMVSPLLLGLARIARGFFNLVTGSGSARDAITDIVAGAIGLIVGLFGFAGNAIFGFAELILRTLGTIVRAIPGARSLLGDDAFLADGLAAIRNSFTTTLNDAVAGVDISERRRQREQAAANSPTVIAQAGETTVEVLNETCVQVDGEDVGRALGQSAVRAGERGTGPRLPATQQGRVLRQGLQITSLRPAEAL